MSKALRLSEKWFQRGLWLVAVVFAGFLIGLGNKIVGDLPKVEHEHTLEDFIDAGQARAARAAIKAAEERARVAGDALEQTRLKLKVTQGDVASRSEGFANWIAARRATGRADQDPEVLQRTRELDELKAREREARAKVDAEEQALLDARQATTQSRRQLSDLEQAAQSAYERALRAQELRVFAYRLGLTLPPLLLAGWLFRTHRQGRWWPFVWGFIFFALFAFFVELVPYLPSYGGYVRYLVGIVITVVVGRSAILGLQRYLERQRAAELQPEPQRRQELGYDTALTRLAKGVCPGCERAVDLKNTEIDFCPHCGIGLFDHCPACGKRKNAFSRFCHACGTPAAGAAASGGSGGPEGATGAAGTA